MHAAYVEPGTTGTPDTHVWIRFDATPPAGSVPVTCTLDTGGTMFNEYPLICTAAIYRTSFTFCTMGDDPAMVYASLTGACIGQDPKTTLIASLPL